MYRGTTQVREIRSWSLARLIDDRADSSVLSRTLSSLVLLLMVAGLSLSLAESAATVDRDPLDDITTSEGFRQPHADILRLYFAIFDRPPDIGGALFWIERYNQGESVERIADHMSLSPEFLDLYGDTDIEHFVETLYRNVLDREPESGGYTFWTSGLASGDFTRHWVLRHFADSSEFVADHRFPGEDDAPAGPPLTRPVGTAGPIVTFSIDIEASLGWSEDEAKVDIVAILADSRSWTGDGSTRFQLVDGHEADVRIRIATPATVDARCSPLRTGGRLSCRNGRNLNINSDRWAGATSFWTASLEEYRAYVINHEMGHFLGFGHNYCPGSGQLAPVMQQQTKSLQGCEPNGWPFPR